MLKIDCFLLIKMEMKNEFEEEIEKKNKKKTSC